MFRNYLKILKKLHELVNYTTHNLLLYKKCNILSVKVILTNTHT